MSDFVAFTEEIDDGMSFLEHHGILNQKWGHRNGPPYPLNAGAHSSGEKSAAKAAGIKVGGSSGKGTIEKIKRFGSRSKSTPDEPEKPAQTAKKELTPEEKREKALEAARSGDAKKIAKNIDQLSTEELRDARDRAQLKNQLANENQQKEKYSKAEMDKQDAIRSGDKEKVKQYADKMSYNELNEAMNKVYLMEKLNHVDPPPTIADRIDAAVNAVDRARDWAEKGIKAYNVMAQVYNSTHKGENQWPEIHPSNNNNKEKSKEQDVFDKLVNQAKKDVSDGVKQTQQEKSYKEKSDEQLRNKKIDYENQKKFEEWKDKQEGKSNKSENETKETPKTEQKKQSTPTKEQVEQAAEKSYNEISKRFPDEEESTPQETKQRKYFAERAPEGSKATFNSNKKQETSNPTEEQQRILEQERESDRRYMEQMNNASKKRMNSYSDADSSYDDIMENYKESMRTSMNKYETNARNKQNAENIDYDDIYDWMDRF